MTSDSLGSPRELYVPEFVFSTNDLRTFGKFIVYSYNAIFLDLSDKPNPVYLNIMTEGFDDGSRPHLSMQRKASGDPIYQHVCTISQKEFVGARNHETIADLIEDMNSLLQMAMKNPMKSEVMEGQDRGYRAELRLAPIKSLDIMLCYLP